MRKPPVVTVPKDGPGAASRTMERSGISSIFVVDSDRYLKGLARIDDTVRLHKKKEKDLESILIRDLYTAYEDTPISDLLSTALSTQYPIAVIDKDYKFRGIVDRAAIINEVSETAEDVESPMHFSQMEENIENGASE
jgi:glycine betaine/proline transport system ATP-binding protein